MKHVAVIGAGSWGTSLAKLLAEKGFAVTLWIYEKELVTLIKEKRENPYYLPGVKLPTAVELTNDLEEAVAGKAFIIVVVPSHVMRHIMSNTSSAILPDSIVISATKGIENETLMRMSQIIAATLNRPEAHNVAVLSGPSFAMEVCQQQPTSVVVASRNHGVAQKVQLLFNTPYFRTYTSTDVIGVELGGALKNVIAIAAGTCDGLGLGNNTKAALLTRGLAEMTRLGTVLGADPMTFAGLSGMGDLILTCNSTMSRNYVTGYRLGKGETLAEIQESRKSIAEGVTTTRSVFQLSRKLGLEMPIAEQVYAIIYEEKNPAKAVKELMTRSLKKEIADSLAQYSKS